MWSLTKKNKTFKNEIKLLIQDKTNQDLYTQTWDQPQICKKRKPLNTVEIKRKFGTAPFALCRTVSFALLLVREALPVPHTATVFPQQQKKNLILIACNVFLPRLAWWTKMEQQKKHWLYWLIWVLPASPLRNTGRTILKWRSINCYYNVVNIITRI